MQDDIWQDSPLYVTNPINGRRIVGICEDGVWSWSVRVNGPAWQDQRPVVIFRAGSTVEAARRLATELGPMRDQDELELASGAPSLGASSATPMRCCTILLLPGLPAQRSIVNRDAVRGGLHTL